MAGCTGIRRQFVYIVTGELRISAPSESKAKVRVRDALIGLEWALWNPTAKKAKVQPMTPDENDDYEI